MVDVSCRDVHKFGTLQLQCEFVRNSSDCIQDAGIINYLNLVYCAFDNSWFPICICGVWLTVLFGTVGSTADDFFCPCLDVMAKVLKLSHNVAGVTFLAFGNGAPDIFSSLAGINQMRPDLVIGSLFGAGIFVTCIVAGSIIFISPFDMVQRPFLRDVIFYLSAVFWTFYLFYTGKVTVAHSLGFIALYIVYLIVVLVGHLIYKKWFKPNTISQVLKTNTTVIITVASPTGSILTQNCDDEDNQEYFWRRRSLERQLSNQSNRSRMSSVSECSVNSDIQHLAVPDFPNVCNKSEETPLLASAKALRLMEENEFSEIQRFLRTASPIDPDLWKNLRVWQKLIRILCSPLLLLLKLTIPVVDHDKHNDNWCKSLVILQMFSSPIFALLLLGYFNVTLGLVFPLWSLMLMFSLIFSLIIMFTSAKDHPPTYHVIFAFIGFICSVVWIYRIANEIVNVLKMIGVVLNLSDAILGLTILAWGNSLSDLIADMSLARQNLPRMGMSGCFGGPLFNLLLGIGIPFSILTLKTENRAVTVSYSVSITILTIFLCLSLISSLVVLPLMKFHTHRPYGVYLFVLYAVFFIFAILTELHYIT